MIIPAVYMSDPTATDTLREVIVVNAYTQQFYGTHRRQVEYGALRSCFKELAVRVQGWNPKLRIAYPKIGAGLGGGDWDIIAPIIDEELAGLDHTLVVLKEAG